MFHLSWYKYLLHIYNFFLHRHGLYVHNNLSNQNINITDSLVMSNQNNNTTIHKLVFKSAIDRGQPINSLEDVTRIRPLRRNQFIRRKNAHHIPIDELFRRHE